MAIAALPEKRDDSRFSCEGSGPGRILRDMEASPMSHDPAELELIRRADLGDPEGLEGLLGRHRARLRRMIKLRLDRRLQGRIDPSDVVQEAYLEVSRRLAEYLRDPAIPFFLWLRLVAGQKLALVHRQHLGVQSRDAGREVSLYRGALPEATSAALAARLIGRHTSPSQAAVKAELKIRLQEALNGMEDLDREVLALRHFEQLTNVEAARVLGISESAACNRYIRALGRLKKILTGPPGGPGEMWP
jgi:RNA polymerase sigma-70 factor (ECF subfamily)